MGRCIISIMKMRNYTHSKDLYSPYQKISAPRSKDLIYTEGKLQLGNKLSVSGFLSRSRLNNNILSGLNNYEKWRTIQCKL